MQRHWTALALSCATSPLHLPPAAHGPTPVVLLLLPQLCLQVLRFFGYFQEAVTESNIENHRVRRVVVLYYLADDTLQVTEPKQDNSGIPQV